LTVKYVEVVDKGALAGADDAFNVDSEGSGARGQLSGHRERKVSPLTIN